MNGTVLVVDDDQAILDLIQLTLEDEGYRVLTSVDGASLATAHQTRPDLILLDLWMPAMNGLEVSRRLRADPTTADIPIVAMSANRDLTAPSVDLPVNDRLPKPFDLDVLVALVARWVPARGKAGEEP